jgi:methionine-rich copper-binding protein CopC
MKDLNMRTHLAIVAALFAALGTEGAYAHAFLNHASPLVGSTVRAAPSEVTLTFTQSLEPAFSSVQVTDAKGARVDVGKAQVSGSTMRIGLKSLGPGTYRVRWQALSVDTHKTQGSFTFQVGGQ